MPALILISRTALKRRYLLPSGIFEIEKEYDSKYVYVPLDFARELTEADNAVSSIEVKFDAAADPESIQRNIKKIYGEGFKVQNRYEQQEIFYKVMKSERLAIFLILTLILIIASFNIIGSLTMLIIEKQRDIEILRSLGANNDLIRKIFIFEGWLISIIGAVSGIVLGFLICWLQQTYGLVKLQSDSSDNGCISCCNKTPGFHHCTCHCSAYRVLGCMVSGKISYKKIPEEGCIITIVIFTARCNSLYTGNNGYSFPGLLC